MSEVASTSGSGPSPQHGALRMCLCIWRQESAASAHASKVEPLQQMEGQALGAVALWCDTLGSHHLGV